MVPYRISMKGHTWSLIESVSEDIRGQLAKHGRCQRVKADPDYS